MKRLTMVFCESSEAMAVFIGNYFADRENFAVKVVLDAESYPNEAFVPDVIVVGEGFGFRPIAERLRENRPKIILHAAEGNSFSAEYDAFCARYDFEGIEEAALRLTAERKESSEQNRNLDERLSGILLRAGIHPHNKGYQYLKVAVKIAVAQPEMVNRITKGLYPAVAEFCMSTPSKVERSIRHAIEVAWCRGKIENLNHFLGMKIYGKEDKPTNSELIALIADKLVIEAMA